MMTEISAFLGVRPRAGPPRNSLQTRVESSGLPKTRCRLRIDLEPASIWGMSAKSFGERDMVDWCRKVMNDETETLISKLPSEACAQAFRL